MAAVAKLWSERGDIIGNYFDLQKTAGNNQDVEQAAALKIQTRWRGFYVRVHLWKILDSTIKIQSHLRGHLGRKRFGNHQRNIARGERDHYFNLAAQEIQRYWRGYYSRKYVHNFSARQQYIARILAAGNTLREHMHENFEKQKRDLEAESQAKALQSFDESIKGMHHLVSTETIPGVYNSPYAAAFGNTPTVAGVTVEQHLRNTAGGGMTVPALTTEALTAPTISGTVTKKSVTLATPPFHTSVHKEELFEDYQIKTQKVVG